MCVEHREPCKLLRTKALIRGVRLIYPLDLMEGDEPLRAGDKLKCFLHVDPDSRDEGADYEGEVRQRLLFTPPPPPPSSAAETSAVETSHKGKGKHSKGDKSSGHASTSGGAVPTPPHSPPHSATRHGKTEKSAPASQAASSALPTTPTPLQVSGPEKYVIPGYVMDIGPKTCQILQDEIAACDLLLSWGVVGVCEIAAFQNGHRALVSASAKKLKSDGTLEVLPNAPRKPLHTVVIGDSNVEWWARFTDSEGERNGDLLVGKTVSYCTRNSQLVTGILGKCSSNILRDVMIRDSIESEWKFDIPILASEEEEEEEEDDEDEDD